MTDDKIKNVEERIGDHFSNWFDLLEAAIDDVVNDKLQINETQIVIFRRKFNEGGFAIA